MSPISDVKSGICHQGKLLVAAVAAAAAVSLESSSAMCPNISGAGDGAGKLGDVEQRKQYHCFKKHLTGWHH